MKFSAIVSLVAFVSAPCLTQTGPMTRGISVQLPAATSAVAYADADAPNAAIITIGADSHIFVGIKPVPLNLVAQQIKETYQNHPAQLYVKADARAPFEVVKEVLNAAHAASFETAVFLTVPSEPAVPGSTVPPMGLKIRLTAPPSTVTAVRLHYASGRPTPAFWINNQTLPWSRLQTLHDVLQTEKQKSVVVEADGKVQFDSIVRVIDVGHAAEAEVYVSLAGM
jgi:biopolymer transport protein ExbD